jgi:hypothetical protein
MSEQKLKEIEKDLAAFDEDEKKKEKKLLTAETEIKKKLANFGFK